MFPVGAVLFTVQHLLGCLEGGGSPMDGFWLYVGFALAVLLLLFVLHWFQYASLYIATYRESANRRVSLAETLRRLPLSFFGNRDLTSPLRKPNQEASNTTGSIGEPLAAFSNALSSSTV